MAVSASLGVSDPAPVVGETVTVTYTVAGNGGAGSQNVTVSGVVTIGGTAYPVSASLALPGTPAASVTYALPICPGLTFSPTSNPAAFTAVIP